MKQAKSTTVKASPKAHLAEKNTFIGSARYRELMALADDIEQTKFGTPLKIRFWAWNLRVIAHSQYRKSPRKTRKYTRKAAT